MENTASDRFMRMTNVAENTVMGDGYGSGSGYGSELGSGSGSGIISSIFKVFALMVILALLGINVFYYLGDATEYTAYVMDPVYQFLGYETSGAVKQTVKTSAKGSKTVVDATAGVLNTSIEFVENVVDDTLPQSGTTMDRSKPVAPRQAPGDISRYKLNERPTVGGGGVKAANEDVDNVLTIDSVSTKASSSVGYCYIGEDRGHRSCAEVSDTNLCMSGEIFPTHDVCINPNLRE